MRVSYFEIYNEEIHDLLSKNCYSQNLEIKERSDIGVYVKDLSTFIVNNAEDMERIMIMGNRRSTPYLQFHFILLSFIIDEIMI